MTSRQKEDHQLAKGIMVVQSSPASADQEDEYNRWYDEIHIPGIRAIPGFTGARRYRLVRDAGQVPDAIVHDYLAVYDLDAPDIAEPVGELRARSAAGEMQGSDALSRDPAPVVAVYQLVEDRSR